MRARETVRLAAIIVLLLPAALFAQSGSSTISGLVKDSTGAPLPGVLMMVRNVETAVAFESLTNEEGLYRVGALVPGSYRVEATVDGFEPAVRAVTLAVSQTLAIDITVEIAKQSESISVEAKAALIDSQSSNIAQTITREMLTALPLPNRAASSLVSLAPGVVMIDQGNGTAENYPVFSVAGGRARNQNFILDGGNASNAVGLTRPQQLTSLPVDAMQEFKVIYNNYGAEFGHSTGGIVVMSTRSGTNQFHGTVFESLRSDALDARNFFASSKPPIHLNQFGGTFGGPIRKGKTFFFGSWERTRQRTSDAVVSTVPTLLNRQGNFSDLRTSAGVPVVVYDPVTGRPFAGNVIPRDRADPVALAALQYFPLPNRQGTDANANNYVGNSESTLDRDILLDRQILESLSWSQRKHAYKPGAEFRSGANDETRDRGSSGSLAFTPLITSNLGAANTGNALASFLLGEVNAGSVQISDLIQTRASYWSFYAQDDWRLTSRLTLNYGLRWEAELPRREINNKMNSFDPTAINPVSGTPGVVTFAGRNGVPERAFATDTNNFGPRVGFAYQLDGSGRTVLRGGTGIFYGPTVSNTIGDAAALGFSTAASFVVSQATTQSAFTLRDGFPAYSRPELTAGLGAVPVGTRPKTAISFIDPHQVAPTSYQANLDLQRELGKGLVVEVGYITNISRHLTTNDLSLNQVAPDRVTSGDTQPLRPFPQFSNVTLINPSVGKSSYHGGFVRLEKRFASGFSFLGHYTRSRYMDDAESANEYANIAGVNQASYMDAYHRNLDWARSASDVPNHLLLTVLYEVQPFTGNRYLDAVLANWRVGGVETVMSGPAFTVLTAANTTNAFPAGPLRPNLVGDPELPAREQTLMHWFNTAAFANPAPLMFGNSPRSVLRGPRYVTTDLTIEKSISLP